MKYQKPRFEIWMQEPDVNGMYKQCDRVGRVCYKSQDMAVDTLEGYKKFMERMLNSGHGEMLEHMTVYLKAKVDYNYDGFPDCDLSPQYHLRHYKDNPFSNYKVIKEQSPNGGFWIDYEVVTTNYRVLAAGNRKDFIDAYKHGFDQNWYTDLQYLCEPTSNHARRITIYIECDRCTGESFIRHRVFSKARESTRHCNYSSAASEKQYNRFKGEITCMEPCWDVSDEAREKLNKAFEMSEKMYDELITECGWKPEQARIVLPFDIKSPLVMTGFDYQWREFLEVRADNIVGRAHPQAQELAKPIKEELIKKGYI